MVDWQGELDALLARLRLVPDVEDPSVEDFPFDAGLGEPHGPPDDADLARSLPRGLAEELREDVEVSAVRTEIEATLRQVLALARAGQLEPEWRADVVFVLSALTRPLPSTPGLMDARRAAAVREGEREWQLASAAAVLRFCRIVTHLTNGVILHVEP